MVELEPVTSGKRTTHPQEHINEINEESDAFVTAELMKRQTTTAYFLSLFPPPPKRKKKLPKILGNE